MESPLWLCDPNDKEAPHRTPGSQLVCCIDENENRVLIKTTDGIDFQFMQDNNTVWEIASGVIVDTQRVARIKKFQKACLGAP